MINFYEDEDFSRSVYIVAADGIVESSLAELCFEYATETTTPRGIGRKIHTRGNELWTWGEQGNCPRRIETFDSEAEAEHAELLCHRYDLLNDDNAPVVYDTESEAEADFGSTA